MFGVFDHWTRQRQRKAKIQTGGLPLLTIIMNVSILDHVRCESQSVGYSFASTERGEIAGHRVDASNGITFVALIANGVGSRCCTGSQEVDLTLPRSGICQVVVAVDPRSETAKVVFPLVDVRFDGDGVFDEGWGTGICILAGGWHGFRGRCISNDGEWAFILQSLSLAG
jgi:hypothetical protein